MFHVIGVSTSFDGKCDGNFGSRAFAYEIYTLFTTNTVILVQINLVKELTDIFSRVFLQRDFHGFGFGTWWQLFLQIPIIPSISN